MKKIAFLFIFIFTALCLASCAGGTCEHEFGEWETLVKASCTAPKVEQRTCTLCDHTEVKKTETKGHKYGEWKLSGDLVDGSCEGSVFAATCAVCNEITFKRGGASSHDFEKVYSADASHHWFSCSVCGEPKNKTQHTKGNDGKCSVCGANMQPTEGIIYDISTDGTYAEVICYTGTATQILIASEYQGLPVKNIYDEAFKDKAITSVIIPDSVTSIGSSAFYDCDALESVTIPDSVTSIGYYAFKDCNHALYTTYEFGTYVGDEENPCAVLIEITNKNLSTYTIHENTKHIAYGVFSGCERLTSITIPDGVKSIGDYAFRYCDALQSITIPDSVTSIGSYAFAYCSTLKSVTIPDSVTSIENHAFSSCSALGSVTIGDSVTSIGGYAFAYCSALESVTIPDSVTSIGSYAFYGCSALNSVIFEDTSTWYRTGGYESWQNKTGGTETDVSNPENMAYYLKGYYYEYYYYCWYKL